MATQDRLFRVSFVGYDAKYRLSENWNSAFRLLIDSFGLFKPVYETLKG
jgi:hypothetical protein